MSSPDFNTHLRDVQSFLQTLSTIKDKDGNIIDEKLNSLQISSSFFGQPTLDFEEKNSLFGMIKKFFGFCRISHQTMNKNAVEERIDSLGEHLQKLQTFLKDDTNVKRLAFALKIDTTQVEFVKDTFGRLVDSILTHRAKDNIVRKDQIGKLFAETFPNINQRYHSNVEKAAKTLKDIFSAEIQSCVVTKEDNSEATVLTREPGGLVMGISLRPTKEKTLDQLLAEANQNIQTKNREFTSQKSYEERIVKSTAELASQEPGIPLFETVYKNDTEATLLLRGRPSVEIKMPSRDALANAIENKVFEYQIEPLRKALAGKPAGTYVTCPLKEQGIHLIGYVKNDGTLEFAKYTRISKLERVFVDPDPQQRLECDSLKNLVEKKYRLIPMSLRDEVLRNLLNNVDKPNSYFWCEVSDKSYLFVNVDGKKERIEINESDYTRDNIEKFLSEKFQDKKLNLINAIDENSLKQVMTGKRGCYFRLCVANNTNQLFVSDSKGEFHKSKITIEPKQEMVFQVGEAKYPNAEKFLATKGIKAQKLVEESWKSEFSELIQFTSYKKNLDTKDKLNKICYSVAKPVAESKDIAAYIGKVETSFQPALRELQGLTIEGKRPCFLVKTHNPTFPQVDYILLTPRDEDQHISETSYELSVLPDGKIRYGGREVANFEELCNNYNLKLSSSSYLDSVSMAPPENIPQLIAKNFYYISKDGENKYRLNIQKEDEQSSYAIETVDGKQVLRSDTVTKEVKGDLIESIHSEFNVPSYKSFVEMNKIIDDYIIEEKRVDEVSKVGWLASIFKTSVVAAVMYNSQNRVILRLSPSLKEYILNVDDLAKGEVRLSPLDKNDKDLPFKSIHDFKTHMNGMLSLKSKAVILNKSAELKTEAEKNHVLVNDEREAKRLLQEHRLYLDDIPAKQSLVAVSTGKVTIVSFDDKGVLQTKVHPITEKERDSLEQILKRYDVAQAFKKEESEAKINKMRAFFNELAKLPFYNPEKSLAKHKLALTSYGDSLAKRVDTPYSIMLDDITKEAYICYVDKNGEAKEIKIDKGKFYKGNMDTLAQDIVNEYCKALDNPIPLDEAVLKSVRSSKQLFDSSCSEVRRRRALINTDSGGVLKTFAAIKERSNFPVDGCWCIVPSKPGGFFEKPEVKQFSIAVAKENDTGVAIDPTYQASIDPLNGKFKTGDQEFDSLDKLIAFLQLDFQKAYNVLSIDQDGMKEMSDLLHEIPKKPTSELAVNEYTITDETNGTQFTFAFKNEKGNIITLKIDIKEHPGKLTVDHDMYNNVEDLVEELKTWQTPQAAFEKRRTLKEEIIKKITSPEEFTTRENVNNWQKLINSKAVEYPNNTYTFSQGVRGDFVFICYAVGLRWVYEIAQNAEGKILLRNRSEGEEGAPILEFASIDKMKDEIARGFKKINFEALSINDKAAQSLVEKATEIQGLPEVKLYPDMPEPTAPPLEEPEPPKLHPMTDEFRAMVAKFYQKQQPDIDLQSERYAALKKGVDDSDSMVRVRRLIDWLREVSGGEPAQIEKNLSEEEVNKILTWVSRDDIEEFGRLAAKQMQIQEVSKSDVLQLLHGFVSKITAKA